ncbi:endospore germination permease [Sporosarcina saromensis]|uniref:Endospore germination permease n=1 Tax=Sporosarcina saromensis TaxID=359365 RepID=A0ABU4GFR5_9BACL|nr:endospore germination permease [Sporosarcina saromensis]MDW0114442.1 endospore germination permease [Sporosarcina saromensis]
MNKIGSISILHVIFLSMTVIGLKNHVTILPPLLAVGGRDSWMAVIGAAVLIFPWLFLLMYIHKATNQEPLIDWLSVHVGQATTSIIRYVLAVFLLIIAAFSLAETLQWITGTFLPESPMLLMLLIYTGLCIVFASSNLQTIVMVNVLVLFWVVVLGFFVAFTNIQVKEYELLLPMLEHGLKPVAASLVYPASGFVELFMLLFLQHRFKTQMRWYHYGIMLFILMGLTIGPLIGAITEFGPDEAAKQRYPAYEEWGLVSIGRFIEHLDFLSIYQWLTGAFVRVGFILYIVTILLKMAGDKVRIWKVIAPPFFFLCASMFLIDDHIFLKIKGKVILATTFLFFFVLSLLLAVVVRISSTSKKKAKSK